MTQDELRAAALDGSIEHKMDWRAVKAGDVFYSPAGTVHAIGPGLTLVEVQQNVDLTYRLYDYGSGRELHLDDGVAVVEAGAVRRAARGADDRAGADGAGRGAGVRHGALDARRQRARWLRPKGGRYGWCRWPAAAGSTARCWKPAAYGWPKARARWRSTTGSDMLVAYPGADVIERLWG